VIVVPSPGRLWIAKVPPPTVARSRIIVIP
jgi:hypothetical protein